MPQPLRNVFITEFPSFILLLEESGARDGQVFVDLGSGVGKAVVAAALSGISFVRCIGMNNSELLA